MIGYGVAVSDLGPPFDHNNYLVSLEFNITLELQTQVKQTFEIPNPDSD